MTQSPVRSIVAVSVIAIALVAGIALNFTNSGGTFFMPHAHCYLFNKNLILLHGGSDLFIGLAYVAISVTLTYLVLQTRRELPFHWMMLAFALFIMACGATHFMEVWTLQTPHPPYWLAGWIKLITATASVITALLLPPLVPKLREVLQNARSAAERKEELEKAYVELYKLYTNVTHPPNNAQPSPAVDDDPYENLANMARKVSVHTRVLETAKEVAEAANSAKDQFLAVLSHELRTPLTPALAAATNLEAADDLNPADLRNGLRIIRRNIELEARLVDDLLDLTRISKGKLELQYSTANLHEIIHHAAEMCCSQAQKNGNALTLSLEATEYHVWGDDSRLTQVIWNLMLNALKFTPAQGKICVCTLNPSPGKIRIEISDTGIGIEPHMLSSIFEPFEQGGASTTRRYGGLGLGLSVAKGFVELHGGSIAVTSEGKGKGAKFRIDLATVATPSAPIMTDGTVKARKVKHLRILLVEDHDDTRNVLERMLLRRGHEVKTACTVAQAVEIARIYKAGLLLSDIGLPDGTGINLIAQVRKTGEMKAIAMSGFGMKADLELSKKAGFDLHLVKPVTFERLNEAIDKLFEG